MLMLALYIVCLYYSPGAVEHHYNYKQLLQELVLHILQWGTFSVTHNVCYTFCDTVTHNVCYTFCDTVTHNVSNTFALSAVL